MKVQAGLTIMVVTGAVCVNINCTVCKTCTCTCTLYIVPRSYDTCRLDLPTHIPPPSALPVEEQRPVTIDWHTQIEHNFET